MVGRPFSDDKPNVGSKPVSTHAVRPPVRVSLGVARQNCLLTKTPRLGGEQESLDCRGRKTERKEAPQAFSPGKQRARRLSGTSSQILLLQRHIRQQPRTLALGCLCKPSGRGSSRLFVRLPERNPLRNDSLFPEMQKSLGTKYLLSSSPFRYPLNRKEPSTENGLSVNAKTARAVNWCVEVPNTTLGGCVSGLAERSACVTSSTTPIATDWSDTIAGRDFHLQDIKRLTKAYPNCQGTSWNRWCAIRSSHSACLQGLSSPPKFS